MLAKSIGPVAFVATPGTAHLARALAGEICRRPLGVGLCEPSATLDLASASDLISMCAPAAVVILPDRLHQPHVGRLLLQIGQAVPPPPVVLLSDGADQVMWSKLATPVMILPLNMSPDNLAALLRGLVHGHCGGLEAMHEAQQELMVMRKAQDTANTWLASVDEEMHLAARVQREMLPREFPKLGSLEFGSLFCPLWHVSGDIFSTVKLDEHRAAFVMADAMGHGFGAAMHAMIIAHELVRFGIECRGSPALALAKINDEMCKSQTERIRFASAVYGVIDSRDGSIELAVAGHQPPLIVGQGRERVTNADGPLLGVVQDAEFISTTAKLEVGETLVIYSDGVEQAFIDTAKAQGLKVDSTEHHRLLVEQMDVDSSSAPLGHTVQGGLDVLGAFLQNRPSSLHRGDDLTVLAIRRR